MRVTRLEIFGFKSFVDRFVLNFDKNMIGIVGPNGCGKSNVVDALRWVLGETHAKHLRGGSFDDLIFNGSDTRRQLGMAEVTLTIRPEPNWKNKIDNEDTEINQIAKLAENLLDEPESVDVIISNEDDHAVKNSSEEVQTPAPQETGGRLDILDNKVSGIPGLFDASEIQFTRRLYRSGESEYFINKSPCRLRDMQELYRLIGLGARGLSIVAQGQIGQFISKKPVERRELLEEAAGISGFRTKMEAASRRLEKTDENLSRVSDIIIEVEKQLKTLRRQASRARARQSLKEELFSADKELFSIKKQMFDNKIERLNSQIELDSAEVEGLRAKIEENDSQITQIDARIHDTDVTLMNFRREKDLLTRQLHAEEAKLQEVRVKLASIDSKESLLKDKESSDKKRLETLEANISELTNKLSVLQEEYALRIDEFEAKKVELKDLEAKHVSEIEAFQNSLQEQSDSGIAFSKNDEFLAVSRRVEELEVQLSEAKDIERLLQESYNDLKSKEKDHNSLERNLNALENEIRAIEKQLSSLVKHTLQATDASLASENARVLLSALTVPQELEKAVHAVLGEKAQYLISDDVLSKLKNYTAQNAKKSRIGIFDVKASETTEMSVPQDSLVSGVTALHSKLSYSETDAPLIKEVLKNTFYASDIHTAIEQKEQFDTKQVGSYVIVTATGEVLTHIGWYTVDGEGVEFSFTRRKAELELESETLKQEITTSKSAVEQAERTHASYREKISSLNQMRQELSNSQKQISAFLKMQSEEEKQHYQKLRNQENELRTRLREIERNFSREVSTCEQGASNAKGLLSQIQYQIEKSQADIDYLQSTLLEYPEQYDLLECERQQLIQSSNDASAAIASEESTNRKQKIAELDSSIEEFENKRLQEHQNVSEFKLEIQTLRRSLDHAERSLRTHESDRDRSVIEIDLITQDYQKTYAEVIIDESLISCVNVHEISDIDSRLKDLQETSSSIRKRLEREGEVDPQSIELCEIEEKRFESMTTQHKDLILAKETLEKTIKQLKELSRIRFVNTFAAVNTKFKELIPRLFSGGSGHLELLNPEDPLQSGVDIVVRPPGKKITTMELMSGGEKALVATAVLVSMFLHHPGPICVLDEIDAPLDDANLVKLLDLVKEIADRTQFLVITHNKITMQAVDRLIGITMQESGVTTALSVTLDEAEKELNKLVSNG